MSEALDHALGDTICFSRPNGGFFFWFELLEKIDAALLLEGAHNYCVGFQPSVKFSSSQSLRNYMRLSFAYYDEHDIERGIDRLTNAIDSALVS